MTKIEMMKQMIEWKIRMQADIMKEAKRRLAETVNGSDLEIAEWALHYAEQFKKAADEIRHLKEDLQMLEQLEKE